MSTPRKRKEKQTLIKCFIVLKPSEKDIRQVSVVTKYCTPSFNSKTSDDLVDNGIANDSQSDSSQVDDIDEDSVSLFCFPNGCEIRDFPEKPSFHTFLITKQNASRIYGSCLVVWEKLKRSKNDDSYINKAFCFLTSIPLVVATRKLLYYIYENNSPLAMIQSICDLRMPTRSNCLKLCLPLQGSSNRFSHSNSKTEDVFIYRGLPSFPLFDYSLHKLFTEILYPEQFLTAFVATLLEFQILLVSESYYTLMMVAEALTSLLLPFSWQHVYVPILPSKLGLNFLDAPTPYIMGVVGRDNEFPNLSTIFAGSMANGVQCRIDCDTNKVEYFTDENSADEELMLFMPSFIDELKIQIENLMNAKPKPDEAQSKASSRIFEYAERNYLEDLKLNQSIRLAFLGCLDEYILRGHEKFIVCAPNRREAVTFDAVSYLCDRPDSIRCFLSKFLKTQMFVSYIDEHVKKAHKNKSTLNCDHQSLLASDSKKKSDDLGGDEHLEEKFKDAILIKFAETVNSNSSTKSGDSKTQLLASPIRRPRQQQSYSDQGRPKPVKSESKGLRKIKTLGNSENEPPQCGPESNLINPSNGPTASTALTNWQAVEFLLRDVKAGTKRILLAKMGNEEIAPLGMYSSEALFLL